MDYVYHYASLVKTYLAILGIKKKITAQFPTVQEIENQLMHSNINEIPKCKTVILGYVQGFEYLSNTENWLGTGDFLWKRIADDKILVGCKHSYWGDIAGYIVAALARKGVKRVIYVGKLGTLNKNYAPNETIATGNKSIFIDGSFVEWNNVFEDFNYAAIKNGIHYTLPSLTEKQKNGFYTIGMKLHLLIQRLVIWLNQQYKMELIIHIYILYLIIYQKNSRKTYLMKEKKMY